MDVFPALLAEDVFLYVPPFDDYWNDIGSLDEYRAGELDALTRRGRRSSAACRRSATASASASAARRASRSRARC